MLNHNNHTNAVASGFLELNDTPPLDKKTRERLAARRKMAARRESEMHAKEYWFDG